MFVGEMAHVCVIDIAPDEPAHRAACDDIGGEVFLGRDSRGAHYSGQTLRSYANDFLALVLVIQQRGD